MKREIKFRVWDKCDNSMKRVIAVREYSVDVPLQRFPFIEHIFDYELMQYTGLKDKNGVEIYEGDILSTDVGNNSCYVIFKNGCFMLELNENGGVYHDIFYPTSDIQNEQYIYSEVIGNIYENPELLTT